ncbi:MAG: serine acetyltransferase [Archangium sp.]|nr:serine acetyltransferase [Archangium sp.]MDP3569174.1 serine acetyltransferase [Archangium sp.]
MANPLTTFLQAVRADYSSVQRYRAKYHGDERSSMRLPVDAVTKIGFQMMIAMRTMAFFRDARVPLLPQVASRLIRHAYGAEVHWNTTLRDGVSIVHGTGLVLSHRAVIGEGCILFHNVTLGEGLDPETKEAGAPTLGRDVHVGPGATLLGPIHVGDRTKIMAGAVLTRSVPAGSLVRPAEAVVTERAPARPRVAR